ncbi:MAG: hypothetical protein LBU42_00290 [Prevotellaceae bacterium]|nr:hypothetical protein [Prevotellaceae bacterium]
MQVERSVTQHGGYMSLPAFRAEHPFSAMHGQCAARKAQALFFRRLRCAGLRL